MKKTLIIFLHFAYWLIYLLMLAVIFSIVAIQLKKTPSIENLLVVSPLIILCLAPHFLSFYLSYFLIFTKFLKQKRIALSAVFGSLICLLSATFAFALALFFFGIKQPVFSDFGEFFPLFASFFFLAAIHAGIALVIRGFIGWFDEVKLKEELAQKNYETEIALLKSQINPHFLFNTINNIDVLIAKDSAKASEYLNRLSDILRYMVYDTKSGKIALSKELDYIEKYLELQKIRTTNPNYVNFEIKGEPNNLKIAPMIFFPFIENAFKHTENNKNSSSIRLDFSITETSVEFRCQNTLQKVSERNRNYGGLGNDLIRKRLELIYHEKHRLKISDENQFYYVNLTLDLSEK